MACGMPSTALLEELAPSRGAVAALDPTPCPRLVLGRLFGLVPSLPQPHGTDMCPHRLLSLTLLHFLFRTDTSSY
jgi:hypothetical protein